MFPRTDAGATKFDGRSDTISMANVGTVSVNVSLTAAIADATGIALSANATDASMGATTDPTMYIEMVKENLGNMSTANGAAWDAAKAGGNPKTADAILLSGNNGSASKSVALSIDKVPGVISNYVVSHNGTNYTYGVSSDKVDAVKSAAYATGQCIKFYFTGATNNGDNIGWKSLVNAKPNLTLTYNITKADADAEEQELAGDATSVTTVYDSTDRMYKTTLPAALTGLSDVTSFTVNGANVSSSNYTLNSSKTILRTTKDGLKAALGVTSLPESFTFTIVANGTTYVSQVSRD